MVTMFLEKLLIEAKEERKLPIRRPPVRDGEVPNFYGYPHPHGTNGEECNLMRAGIRELVRTHV